MAVFSDMDLSRKCGYPDKRFEILMATSACQTESAGTVQDIQPEPVQQPVHAQNEAVSHIDPCTSLPETEPIQPVAIPVAKKKKYYKHHDNSKIIQFLQYIQATPNFSNSFKVLKANGKSGFRTLVFYRQSEGCGIVNNVFFGKKDYYITKNSYVGNQTREENLFSLDNIVIDIDNHRLSSKDVSREVERLLYFLDADYNGKLPRYGIVRTGRGVQLWIGLESMAATDKLIYRYRQISEYFCNVLKAVIEEYGINLEVDFSASVRPNGLVRLPETRNAKRRDKYIITYERFPLIRYQWQELIEEYTSISLTSNKDKKTAKKSGQKPAEQKSKAPKPLIQSKLNAGNDYTPFTLKQIRFIKRLVEINNGNVEGRRELFLFHYFNALVQAYNVDTAKQMTAELNQMFTNPLSETEISCAVKSPQKKVYHYSKVRFLADICVNDDEKQLYNEITEDREEKRQKAREKKIQRNRKIIQLKEQDMSQKAIAQEVGCHPDTVGAILKEYNENGRVQRDKQIIALYQQGMTAKAIAGQVGCSQTVVNKVLQTVKKESKTERNAKIIQLHQQGMTAKAIAEKTGCSKRTVDSVISDYKNTAEKGVQKKQKSEKKNLNSQEELNTTEKTEKSQKADESSAKIALEKGVQKKQKSEKPP